MKAGKSILLTGLLILSSFSLPAQNVSFSKPHGLYETDIEVTITPGKLVSGVIHYTTDGRIPCPSDPIYTQPLKIDRTTVLRAAAMPQQATDDNYATPVANVATATYLFVESVLSQSDTPEGYPTTWGPFIQISGSAPADYGMDQELLADESFRQKARQGLVQLPSLSIATDPDNLFSHERNKDTGGIYIYTGAPIGDSYGEGWERPVSFELFDSNGQYDIQADCMIRLHGGHSSVPEKNPKHSFRVMFRNDYQGKLEGQLFGPESPDKYSSLVIRTFGNNSWQHWRESNRMRAQCTRDMWARETQRKMGHEYIQGTYVHLYLNGIYWGVFNLSERPDDDYCSTNFGGKSNDYDVYKDNELFKGGSTLWTSMKAKADSIKSLAEYQKKSHKVLERLEPILDLDNFIDYMILSLYAANTDWDMHNWVAFANRKKGTGFKFLCWDSELILGELYENVTGIYDGMPTKLLNKLMNDVVFKHRFSNRVLMHCYNDGQLTPDSAKATWNSLYHLIDMALYDESARWGDYRRDVHPYEQKGYLYTPDNYFATERKRLLEEYFPKRTEVLISQLKEKGWIPQTDAPRLLVDGKDLYKCGDTIFAGSALSISSKYTIYYTLNGDDPVSFEKLATGDTTSYARKYTSALDLADIFNGSDKEYMSLTIRTACRNKKEWSPTLTRTVVIQNPTITGVVQRKVCIDDGSILINGKIAKTVVTIAGTVVSNSSLKPGIYIADGVKVIVNE